MNQRNRFCETQVVTGFGSSVGYVASGRGVQPALKLSGLTKREIAKAIRGLTEELNGAVLYRNKWEKIQRIAVAIGELASIAAWNDAANLDGEQAT